MGPGGDSGIRRKLLGEQEPFWVEDHGQQVYSPRVTLVPVHPAQVSLWEPRRIKDIFFTPTIGVICPLSRSGVLG